MNRVAQLFQKKDRDILSVYFTAGFPALDSTGEIIRCLAAAGVDMIEVGVPFSDPMADGVVIQQSSTRALQNGMTLPRLLDQLEELRRDCQIPLVLMGYLNPMMQYGLERLFERCHNIGIDAMIIPDLPFQEYMQTCKTLSDRYGIPVIMLITPETSVERIRLIDEHCGGFIYMVSSASTTGTKERFTDEQIAYFQSVDRLELRNKRLIGFGVSNSDTFETACRYCHGAIVGSSFVRLLSSQSTVGEAVEKLIQKLY